MTITILTNKILYLLPFFINITDNVIYSYYYNRNHIKQQLDIFPLHLQSKFNKKIYI